MARWKRAIRQRRRRKHLRPLTGKLVKSRRIVFIAKIAFIAVAALFLISIFIFPIFAFNLPSPDKIVRHEGFSTKILDRNGEVLYDIYADQKRIPVKVEDIPNYLKEATVAI